MLPLQGNPGGLSSSSSFTAEISPWESLCPMQATRAASILLQSHPGCGSTSDQSAGTLCLLLFSQQLWRGRGLFLKLAGVSAPREQGTSVCFVNC